MQQLKQECESNLSEIEESHLRQLRAEILEKHPGLAEELKRYMMLGDFSMISMKKSMLSGECGQLKNYLTRGLTKAGSKYTLDAFLEKAWTVQGLPKLG
jgi:hypothetical protein